MEKRKELDEKTVPVVRIGNSLENYKENPIFQEKLDKANEVLKKVGIPRELSK